MYLYVARLLDPRVVQQLRNTQESVGEYANLEARRLGIQIAFALMFAVIALIVLLSSAWIGLDFANRLVAPIRRLIGAANVVSTGNLHVQVPVHRSEGDLAQLGETFNKMTQELRTQHEDIVRARDLIDSRRRFTEAVLAGASAGVIGVNGDGRISILNRSAERLIGRVESEVLGLPLAGVAPELAEIFQAAHNSNQRLVQRQIAVSPRRPGAQLFGARDQRTGDRIRTRLRHHHRRHYRTGHGAAHLGVGRHRAPHRPRDQKSADPDPACRPSGCAENTASRSPRILRCSRNAPTPSSARSTTSSAWSTSSRASPGCRRPWSPTRTSPRPCARSCFCCASAIPTSISKSNCRRRPCRRASTAG